MNSNGGTTMKTFTIPAVLICLVSFSCLLSQQKEKNKEDILSESKVTMVVLAVPNPAAMEDMETYLTKVHPILDKYGGEHVFRGQTDKAVIGNASFGIILVMNFDSAETIVKMFDSPEYKALIPSRDRGFLKMDVVITNAM